MYSPSDDHDFPPEDYQYKLKRKADWKRLENHLRNNYHAPDIEGVKIVTSAVAAHFVWKHYSPVWLFVMGASGTGKTSLVGSIMSAFPFYHALSNLTPQTLLSGLTMGKKKELGLLQRLGPEIIFFISYLSSITGMREDHRAVVMAQLREIYDGDIHKDYGTGKREDWSGKATVIAGCTPAIERLWSLGKELGERFMTLRWRHGNLEELAVAATQISNEREMREETRHLVREWLGDMSTLSGLVEKPGPEQIKKHGLDRLAATVSQLRVTVTRDRGDRGASNIIEIGHAEGPGRIIKALELIAVTHAGLMGRSEISEEDLDLARRVARETLPGPRATVLDVMAKSDRLQMNTHDIWQGCSRRGWGVSVNTVRSVLEDLVALRVVEVSEHSGAKWFKFSPWFEERRDVIGWGKPQSDSKEDQTVNQS